MAASVLLVWNGAGGRGVACKLSWTSASVEPRPKALRRIGANQCQTSSNFFDSRDVPSWIGFPNSDRNQRKPKENQGKPRGPSGKTQESRRRTRGNPRKTVGKPRKTQGTFQENPGKPRKTTGNPGTPMKIQGNTKEHLGQPRGVRREIQMKSRKVWGNRGETEAFLWQGGPTRVENTSQGGGTSLLGSRVKGGETSL